MSVHAHRVRVMFPSSHVTAPHLYEGIEQCFAVGGRVSHDETWSMLFILSGIDVLVWILGLALRL